jgi:ABC-type dipeptide/oligopeptide/nickel transport system permease subunit
VIEVSALAFGAVLLLGSIGAFFFYIPFLPVAVVVVMMLGLALTFMIGIWMGSTRIVRLRVRKFRRDTA